MTPNRLYGGMEAGGTKFVCVVASGPGHTVDQLRYGTTTPAETLERAIQFFRPFVGAGEISSIGVGAFGPLDLNPQSPTYGFITATPKPGWSNADVRGTIQRGLNVNVALDTDVNVA